MSNNRICFTVAFPDVPEPIVGVWNALTGYLKNQKCLPKQFEVQQICGHPVHLHSEEYLKLTPEDVKNLIIERNLDGFCVTAGRHGVSVEFRLAHGKESGRQSYIWSVIDEKAKAPEHWNGLIEDLMSANPAINGLQWRSLYRTWQNAPFLDRHYEKTYGQAPPGIRTCVEKSIAGISPDRVRIKTSFNPGRSKELLPTIYFLPTSEMWLGPHFWQYAKCTKEEALAADFWLETRDTPHYTYFKCWPTPFTRPDGEQGRMQQRLWKLFFHEDCEWPPGSGTICDEPMYGPLELMPQSPGDAPA
jgi:hypothetical protein